MLRKVLLSSVASISILVTEGYALAQPSQAIAAPQGTSSASVSTGIGDQTTSPLRINPGTKSTAGNAALQGNPPADGKRLEEIVVTAEKRKNTAQKTAASLEVISSDTLAKQRIVQVQDLNQVLPSVQVQPLLNAIQFNIRGIGSDFIDPRADPAVAASVNGLFFDRPLPVGFAFLDVARVEDLNGPAGTLYGRNAAGGAINIITNQSNDRFGGSVSAEGGNYGENDFTGVLNVPLTSTLDARLAYGHNRRDGYVGNYYDDINSDTVRLSAKWLPTDDLTIYGEADYQHQGGHGAIQEFYPCGSKSRPWSLFVPAGCSGLLFFQPGEIPATGATDTYVQSFQLHVDYDLGWATATSIFGFVGNHPRFYSLPTSGVLLDTSISDNNDYTEELRLTGHDSANHQGGLAWQLGTFLFFSNGDYNALAVTPFSRSRTYFRSLPQSSEAGFAQATYGITDHLRVTAGLRYTHDFKGLTDVETFNGSTLTSKLGSDGYRTTFKAGLEYDLAPRNLLYANIASGYVAGGPDGGSPSLPTPDFVAPVYFRPETTTAYEIGSKNRFLDDRLQLNANVYYSLTKHLQITEGAYLNDVSPPVPPNFTVAVENIGSVKNYGVEASGTFALTSSDRLSASVTYAQGTYGASSVAGLSPFFTSVVIQVPRGSTAINVPQWAGLLGFEHTWTIFDDNVLAFSVNSKLSTRYHLVIGSNASDDVQSSYTSTDVGLSYTFGKGKYVLRGYIKNVENSAVNVYGQAPGQNVYGILPPRTYGGGVTVNF